MAAQAVTDASVRYGQYFVAFKRILSYLHQIGKNNIPEIHLLSLPEDVLLIEYSI